MAETTKKNDNRVEVHILRAGEREEPNLFVGVNGRSYLLPRGKSSMVPPEVAEEIKRSGKAQDALDLRRDKLLEKSK